jgi:hypothetical protein|tara:strand:+ start:1204 stop:1416 length:213 start_codon:yes stop_codon:yes gene_type:complete
MNKDVQEMLDAEIKKVSSTMVLYKGSLMLFSQLKTIAEKHELKAFLIDTFNIKLLQNNKQQTFENAIPLF